MEEKPAFWYETIETTFRFLEKTLNESGGEIVHVRVSRHEGEDWYRVILRHSNQ